ncbi:MAG TPA: lipocalin-like domain-containing protein [Candidatus Aquilonibacter sp.]|nr:lipocalin-like domain-containing protein [Candidatus Aquilonibacter sp.]
MQRFLTCCLLLFVAGGTSRTPHSHLLRDKLSGAWRLVTVEGQPPGLPGFYVHPSGLLVYGSSGTMSVQIANRSGRKGFAGGLTAGTAAEKKADFDSYFSYYGTYTVDDAAGTVTHHIQDSSYPDLRGRSEVRWAELEGNDRLVLIPQEDGRGGVVARKDARYRLIWERIR